MDNSPTGPITRDLEQQPMSTLTFKLLLALLVLASISIVAATLLLIVRRVRRNRRKAALPLYNELPETQQQNHANFKGSTSGFLRRGFTFPMSEKREFMDSGARDCDQGPLPEIHIHHVDEFDEAGEKAPGKVVVVRVGEAHVPGSEHDDLPPYEKLGSTRPETTEAKSLKEDPR